MSLQSSSPNGKWFARSVTGDLGVKAVELIHVPSNTKYTGPETNTDVRSISFSVNSNTFTINYKNGNVVRRNLSSGRPKPI